VRRPLPTLLLLCCVTALVGLGRQAITDSDEAYYAEASKEMLVSGDWLTPHFNYRDRWEKPVLYYWLTAATYALTGPTEFAARTWSAFAGIGLALLTWSVARQAGEPRATATLAGAIVATSFGLVSMARVALPDLPLTTCITGAVWSALRAIDAGRHGRRWMVMAGLFAGLGFLMKGPVALVVPAIVLAPIVWRERRAVHLRPADLLLGAAVAAGVGTPWYIVMTATHGAPYLQSFFVGDNLERFATSRFNAPRPLFFYVPVVLGGLLPWTAYLLTIPLSALIRLGAPTLLRGLTPWQWRLLLWAALPLIFFSISIGQQPRYVLPVLPPLAVLTAIGLSRRVAPRTVNTTEPATPPDGLAAGTWLTAGLLLACVAITIRLRGLFDPGTPGLWFTVAALTACAAALGGVALTRRWTALPGLLMFSAALSLSSIQLLILPGGRPDAVEQMAAMVRVHRSGTERVAPYRVFTRNLVFYTGIAQDEIFSDEQANAFLTSPDRVLMVVRPADLARLTGLPGQPIRTLGQVEYVNTADIRLRTLLAPDPAAIRETVLLVTNR